MKISLPRDPAVNLKNLLLLLLTLFALGAEAGTLAVGSITSREEQIHGPPDAGTDEEIRMCVHNGGMAPPVTDGGFGDVGFSGPKISLSFDEGRRVLGGLPLVRIQPKSLKRHRLNCVDLR